MAASAIPGLDVEELYNVPRTRSPAGGWAPGSSSQASSWGDANRAWAAAQDAAKTAGQTAQGIPEAGTATAAVPESGTPGGINSTLRSAGSAAGTAAREGVEATAPILKRAGTALGRGLRSNVPWWLSGIAETAGHGNFYADPNVPLTDKLRVGATDLLGTGGGGAGAIVGGAAGGAAVPIVGAPAGFIGGGYAGQKAGRALGNLVFGSDDAMRRAGYDPNRTVVDAALDLARGKGTDTAYGAPDRLVSPDADRIWSLPGGPNPAAPTSLRDAGAGRGLMNPPNATAPQPAMRPITDPGINPAVGRSIVTRDGNSFSGSNISGDVAYKDAKTGQITVPAPRVSVVPGVGNYSPGGGITAGGLRSGDFGGTDAALSAAREAAANRGDWGAVANSYAPAGGGNANPYPTAEDLGLRGRRADRYTQTMAARMSMDTQRAINERNVEMGLRGQDLTYAGHMLGNRLAANRMMYDMWKDQRDFGAQQQERDLAARNTSDTATQKQYEEMFRTTNDKGESVPDMGKIASYKTALTGTLPAMVNALRATGTPQALAKAQELEQRGVSALSPNDHRYLQQLFNTRELARQTYGSTPGQSGFVDSNNLFDYQQAPGDAGLTRGVAGRMVRTRNGTTIDTDKLTYGPSGNTIFPNWFTAPNTDLTQGLRLR